MKVVELRAELKKLGQPTTGRKAALEARLAAARGSAEPEPARKKRRKRDSKSVRSLFERLAALRGDDEEDFDPEQLQQHGMLQLCEELGVENPESDTALIGLAFRCEAEQMGEFALEEFERGFARLGCRNVSELAAKLPSLRSDVTFGSANFEQIFDFVFGWACPPGQKTMPAWLAAALWRVLLREQDFAHIEALCSFLEDNKNHNGVSKDSWSHILSMVEIVNNHGLAQLEDNPAWPVLIDDFVEHVQKLKA